MLITGSSKLQGIRALVCLFCLNIGLSIEFAEKGCTVYTQLFFHSDFGIQGNLNNAM